MAQKKAHEVDSWLRRPDAALSVILLYGPDRGMVSERARALVAASGMEADDPFAVVRLEAGELDASPGRLIDEAQTVPMFSDRRLIWIRGGSTQKALADEVKLLLEDLPPQTTVIIEAGELRKGTALRSLVEGAAKAIALPCYPDETRSLDTLIDEELTRAGLTITMEARHLLRSSLGGDRLATRGELEKLCLYCRGQGRIEVEDVRATTGDVSMRTVDDAVDAMLAGRAAEFDAAFTQLAAAGGQAFLVLAAAMRQFQQLQSLRAEMDQGDRNAAAVVAAARPPVFFARRKLVEGALRGWSAAAIARALERLQGAVLATRRQQDLASAFARQAMLALTLESARAGRQHH